MMARPKGDLGGMVVSKGEAARAIPHQPRSAAAAPEPVLTQKALTVKITGQDYARLRAYCHRNVDEAGREPTHQAIMVKGLRALLDAAEE